MTQINHNSMISVGLALTLAGVIFSAGILKTRVDTNIEAMAEFKTETRENFTAVNAKLDKLMEQRLTLSSTDSAN